MQEQMQKYIDEHMQQIEQSQKDVQYSVQMINQHRNKVNAILDNRQVYQKSERLLDQFMQIRSGFKQLQSNRLIEKQVDEQSRIDQSLMTEMFDRCNGLCKEISQKLDKYVDHVNLEQLEQQEHCQQQEMSFQKLNNIFMQNKFWISNESQQFNSYEIKVNDMKKQRRRNVVEQSVNHQFGSPKQSRNSLKHTLDKVKSRNRYQDQMMNNNMTVLFIKQQQINRNTKIQIESPRNNQKQIEQIKQSLDDMLGSPKQTIKGIQQHSKQMSMNILRTEGMLSPRRRKQNSQLDCINMILESQNQLFNKNKLQFR